MSARFGEKKFTALDSHSPDDSGKLFFITMMKLLKWTTTTDDDDAEIVCYKFFSLTFRCSLSPALRARFKWEKVLMFCHFFAILFSRLLTHSPPELRWLQIEKP
jgi:hypothetical protein